MASQPTDELPPYGDGTESHLPEPGSLSQTLNQQDTRDKLETQSKKSDNLSTDSEKASSTEGGVFGGDNGNSFRNVGRWGCLFALITNQLGLGVLSLPACLKTLGLIPGMIAILGIGALAWYTGLEIYQFYVQYPSILNIVDAIGVVGGPTWEVIVAILFVVQQIMICSSTVVTLSIAFNTLSSHSVCTVGFMGIATIGCFILTVPRTVKFVARAGVPTFISIISAALIVTISLGVSKPPNAPADWTSDFVLVAHPTFREACNAIFRILLAYAGHSSFISYMAEMRDPKKDFPFSMSGLFLTSVVIYAGLAMSIYALAGSYTTSPALGSAPTIAAKAAYGVVLVAVFTTAVGPGHVGIKFLYVRLMSYINAADQITANTRKSWTAWLGCLTVFWITCFIIANAIPVFDSILSISSATTYAWLGYGTSSVLWFHLNKGSYFDGSKQIALFTLNVAIIMLTLFMNSAGLWAAIDELLEIFNSGTGIRGPFDCGNNALF